MGKQETGDKRNWEKRREGNFGRAIIYEINSKLIYVELVRNGNKDYVNIEISCGDITSIWSGNLYSGQFLSPERAYTQKSVPLCQKKDVTISLFLSNFLLQGKQCSER